VGVAVVLAVLLVVGNLARHRQVATTAPKEAVASETWPSALDLPVRPRSTDDEAATGHQTLDLVRAGNAAYAAGDFASAFEHYKAAVALNPNSAEGQSNLAQVLVRRGDTIAALPHLDAAIRLVPDRWTYRFNRARAYGLLQRWQDAVTEYEAARQLFPDDYATHYNLGLALMSLRRFPEAVRSLEQAVAMAPDESSFLISLGTALVGAEQTARARAVFEQFLDRVPTDPEVARVKALLGAMTAAGQ